MHDLRSHICSLGPALYKAFPFELLLLSHDMKEKAFEVLVPGPWVSDS